MPLSAEHWLFSRVLASLGGRNIFAPSLTDMGPIDPARLDFGALVRRAHLVTPLIFPPIFGAGVSGFRDTLTLTAGFCASGVDGGMMNELFDRWLREMPI